MGSTQQTDSMRNSIANAISSSEEAIEIPWLSDDPTSPPNAPVADVNWQNLVQESNRYKLRNLMPRLDGVPTVGDYFQLMQWTRQLLHCFKAHQAS